MGTKNRGFSLIELMIVVAIIAILAGIAYPSYQAYVIRSNRAAAQNFLMEVSSSQRQYMLDNRSYASDLATLGLSLPSAVSGRYTLTFSVDNAATPPSYTLTATPVSGSTQAGDGNLTINHLNTKTGKW